MTNKETVIMASEVKPGDTIRVGGNKFVVGWIIEYGSDKVFIHEEGAMHGIIVASAKWVAVL